MEPTNPESNLQRNKRRARLVASMLLGVALGASCILFPPEYQVYCKVAAKILGLFLGAP